MAHALPAQPLSPFPNMSLDDSFVRGCASVDSTRSLGTVRHHKIGRFSSSSMSSVDSFPLSSLQRQIENASLRSVSSFNLNVEVAAQLDQRCSPTVRRPSFTSSLSSTWRCEPTVLESNGLPLGPVAESPIDRPGARLEDGANSVVNLAKLKTAEELPEPTASVAVTTKPPSSPQSPFRRWMNTLRRKKQPVPLTPRIERCDLDDFDTISSLPGERKRHRHRKSDSWASSSMEIVRTVKSATVTFATASVATTLRRNSKLGRGQHSSIVSSAGPRSSIDSHRSFFDEAARQRSRKRRVKVEELIRTEESYVADIKALSNAYFTLLGHQATAAPFARSSAQRTIAELLHLHDDILGQLHHVVPFAEYDQHVAQQPKRTVNHRWHSIDIVPTRSPPTQTKRATMRQGRRSLNISRSSDDEHFALLCTPQTVALVAKAFRDHIDRFRVYEEFGAKFELVQRDLDEIQQTVAAWADYDGAIEAIAAHINPVKTREANKKKAMTVKDLLIKPIQRLPRYELLFSDLCKLTPVCDDPDAHTTVQETLDLLGQACQSLDDAKRRPTKCRMLETTWLIGDRLVFAGQLPRNVFLQLLGQVVLCGCLHVAYRGKERIKGCYMICILFETTLMLAVPDEDQSVYRILAGISLPKATIEECDNGKGLQCQTAPHSWKLVFEHGARMYEIILTACSATEASAWRDHLTKYIAIQCQAVAKGTANSFELQSSLTLEMRSIGQAFGKPGSFVRRMSVHRTATVGPTSDLNQVVIKNTQAEKEALSNVSNGSLQLPRSQSVATPSHVQTLAPRRAERARLESLLADVWTKDLLPYPGMTRRTDPIRASANHVIRKFSMASITSNFSSKRSASHVSIAQSLSRKEDMPPPKLCKASRTGRPPAPKIDFQTAPEAFLPPDFELRDPGTKRKKSALRTFTMNIERPFSPLLGTEVKPSGLRRAQSVRNVITSAPRSIPGAWKEECKLPVYSVPQDSAKTASTQERPTTGGGGEAMKTPLKSKSKSKLLRLFG